MIGRDKASTLEFQQFKLKYQSAKDLKIDFVPSFRVDPRIRPIKQMCLLVVVMI